MRTKVVILVLLLSCSCSISFAQSPDVKRANWLLGVMFKLERMKDKATADIQQCEETIQKCDAAISKCQNIIKLAQEQGNAQAEAVARRTLAAAQEAKTTNGDNKKLAELNRHRAEEALAYVKTGGKDFESKVEQLESANMSAADSKSDRIRRLREECARLEKQLELDTRVMKEFQQRNEKGCREIEEWAKESEEAQNGALMAGANLLLAGTADWLEKQANSARSFKGWVTRYDKEIRQKGIPVEALQAKLEKALNGYVEAAKKATAGWAMKEFLLKPVDTWKMVRNEIGAIVEMQKNSDALMKEILEDPELKKIIQTDHAAVEFSSSLVVMMAHSKELDKVMGPEADLAKFVVDYGYDAKKWWDKRCAILEQSKLFEKDLETFKGLKKQQVTTMGKLKECRALLAIAEAE